MTTEFKHALAASLKLLEARERLSAELHATLTKKGHEEPVIEEVLSYLREKNFLNDDRAIQSLVAKRSGKRAVGGGVLQAELEKLGVPSEAIESHLAATRDAEPERALDALRAKFKTGTDRVKAGRFLFGRGFSEEAIESALDAFITE